MGEKPKTVLFLCTGNYYRSRFAEVLFDHLARGRGLNWEADSRGLALERGLHNVGPIAQCVRERCTELAIPLGEELRMPLPVTGADLEVSDLVVALKEAEHRELLTERWPGWEERVTYWHVHDVDAGTTAEALAGIESEVGKLIDSLK